MASSMIHYNKCLGEQNIKELLPILFEDNLSNDEFKKRCEEINDKLSFSFIQQIFLYPHKRNEIFLGNYIFDYDDRNQTKICDLSFSIEDKLTVFYCRYADNNNEIVERFCIRVMLFKEPEKYDKIFEYCEKLYHDCGFVPEYPIWTSTL